jgi:hypothetical protein
MDDVSRLEKEEMKAEEDDLERRRRYRRRCERFAGCFNAVLQAWYARVARMDKRKDETTP